jgi:hypothetical protein
MYTLDVQCVHWPCTATKGTADVVAVATWCLFPSCPPFAGEILEVQAASNNTIKGGLTAEDEPADKQGLVTACTGGLLHASGQASSPALQAGVSISAADATANFSGTPQGEAPTSSTGRIHEGPPAAVEPHGLSVGVAGGQGGAQMLRMYQPADVEEFQVGEKQQVV